MTFSRAGEFLDTCDCDECDNIPPPIRRFIHKRKRQRLTAGPIKRTQQRILVGRHDRISLWCVNMPKNADPLIEFGSSHRIVWIKQLRTNHDASDHKSGILRWIGKGIIGSHDEQNSRERLVEWTEGKVFLVPSNGGKAVGWIYASDSSHATRAENGVVDDVFVKNSNDQSGKGNNFAILYLF